MKISLGCDEAAYQLKETIKQHLQEAGHEVIDNGVGEGDNSIQNFFMNIRSKRYSIPNIFDQYERTNDNTNGIPFFKFFS